MIQRNPVEWVVDWPLAWLLTYSGSDCDLWRLVYRKCMGSELCRRLIELLLDELAKHKCYDPALIDNLDAEIIETNTPQPTNQPRPSKPQQRTTRNHSNLKTKAPQLPKLLKLLSRLCPESLPEVPQTHLPSPNPPLIDVFQRDSPGSRGFGVEPSPALGGSPPPDHWVQQEIQMDRVGGGFRSPGHIGFSKRSRWAEAAEGEGGFEGMRGRQ